MRESRKYGSVRGARDETRVPTATAFHFRDTLPSFFGHGIGVRCADLRRRRTNRGTKMTTSVLNAAEVLDIRSALKRRLSGAACLPAQPISRTQELEHLAQADWHIAEVKSHITRQRLRVKHALDTGQCSEVLDSMLCALEASLRAFERHRELVLNQLTRRLSQ
jgi:hypothetical protein